MKASCYAGRWMAALILVLVVIEVSDAVRADAKGRATAMQTNAAPGAAVRPLGIPHDWSHRHLIFSRPASRQAARYLEQQSRYRIQQAWRHRQAVAGSTEAYMQSLDALAVQLAARAPTPSPTKRKKKPRPTPTPHPRRRLHGDWSVSLGSSTATVGAGRYPAKFSFDVNGTPDCTNDFVVFNTSRPGSSGQASIVAFNKLYTGCPTPVPRVNWSYNTGGSITNSVALSGDGSQVAFVQTVGGIASLVLLKWAASTTQSVNSPLTLAAVSNSSYPTCTSPCMTSFSLMVSDTNSAPFYDYANDVIYVGDDNGQVHKFTGVFKGTPNEVTSGWPDTVTSGVSLTGPVLDSGVSPPILYVAYANSSGAGLLGYVNTSTAGAFTKSALIGKDVGVDIADAPVVDSVAGKIYVVVGRDGAGTNSGVIMFNRGFSNGNAGTEATIGTGASSSGGIPLYVGAYDDTYYNSSNATGNLYVCGNAGGNPTLYQVPISAGAFTASTGNTAAVVTTGGSNPACSPVTEIYNPNASGGPFDWIFVSVQGSGSLTNCSGGGCVMNFIVTAWEKSTAYSLNQEVLDSKLNIQKVTTAGTSGSTQPNWNTSGTTSDGTLVWTFQGSMSASAASRAEGAGTSGIIVDNVSATAGASQVYFSTLTGGNGVQASQSGLQ